MVTNIAEMIPAAPWVRWPKVLELLGDALNYPKLADLIDMNIAAQAAQTTWQEEEPQNQPMLKGQVGRAGNRGTTRRPSAGKKPGAPPLPPSQPGMGPGPGPAPAGMQAPGPGQLGLP